MCKYSHLTIGEIVQFTATGSCECGNEIETRTSAKYQGHAVIREFKRDVFELLRPVICSKCGRVGERYIEICQDENVFERFINTELEV